MKVALLPQLLLTKRIGSPPAAAGWRGHTGGRETGDGLRRAPCLQPYVPGRRRLPPKEVVSRQQAPKHQGRYTCEIGKGRYLSGLPTKVRQLISKARDAATLAADVYNRPATAFRTSAYIALMIVAWTALSAQGRPESNEVR